MKRLLLILISTSVFAASPIVYPIGHGGAGYTGKAFEIKRQAVPTSLTVVTATDAHILGLSVTNTTGGAITFLLQDGQGSPVAFLDNSYTVAAHSWVIINAPYGDFASGGFSVQAGGAGLVYYATWK